MSQGSTAYAQPFLVPQLTRNSEDEITKRDIGMRYSLW